MKSSPACQRAVLETVDALRKQGHECVEIELPDGLPSHLPCYLLLAHCLLAIRAFEIFVGLTSSDGYRTMLSHLGPDPKVRLLHRYLDGSAQSSI